jgi:hypothetical protein
VEFKKFLLLIAEMFGRHPGPAPARPG